MIVRENVPRLVNDKAGSEPLCDGIRKEFGGAPRDMIVTTEGRTVFTTPGTDNFPLSEAGSPELVSRWARACGKASPKTMRSKTARGMPHESAARRFQRGPGVIMA